VASLSEGAYHRGIGYAIMYLNFLVRRLLAYAVVVVPPAAAAVAIASVAQLAAESM